jgi:hypothetical protein
MFSFFTSFLHDDNVLLLFYLNDPKILWQIVSYLQGNNFKILQKWILYNPLLKFAQPFDPTKTIIHFIIFPRSYILIKKSISCLFCLIREFCFKLYMVNKLNFLCVPFPLKIVLFSCQSCSCIGTFSQTRELHG